MTALPPEPRGFVERVGRDPVRVENPETRAIALAQEENAVQRLPEPSGVDHSDPSLLESGDFPPWVGCDAGGVGDAAELPRGLHMGSTR